MAKEKEIKTNVMRILDKEKIDYVTHFYEHNANEAFDGNEIAIKLRQNPEKVFKTLVAVGKSNNNYVFVIPVCRELNLKAAAAAVGEKSVEMIHVKDINRITGYIRGGCSPVGMKKQFVTVFDESALKFETIMVSGGKIGTQVELAASALIGLVSGKTAEIATA